MNDREANAELTWPESSSPVHAQLDTTASCSVCNDFYDTPLVLPCGHSFCSNCIRSYVSHQQGQAKCPQCRAACDERDLRPNTALRDLVDKLLQARPAYIAALRTHKAGYSRLVRATAQPIESTAPGTSSNKRQLRSSRTASAPVPVSPTLEDAADLQVLESPRKRRRLDSGSSAAASSSVPASAKSKTVAPSSADVAACPICNRTFKAGRVLEAHVNRCIDNPPPPSQDPPVPEQPKQHAQRPLQKKGLPQVKVPAKIAFHLFNDKKLRDKLKDVNLPVTGKRKELEDRYNRLRLEVQLAADRGEAASEAELVRRTMAKEKTAIAGKGFFGAARGAAKGSGGFDTAPDGPDMPEEDFDSFAALIRATKERDAARRAKQQQSQAALPQSAAYDAGPKAEAAARAALPQANEQRSDMDATVVAAEGSCQPVKSETRLAACPVRVLPSGQLKVALPSESGTCLARLNSQDADGEAPWNISSVQVGAANSALMVPNDRQPGIQHGPAEAQYRVDLTLGDTPSKLSQESLAVEVDDDASPVSSQKVQDQRALQQLQLLNNSTEPVSVSSACNRKSIQLSQDKEHAVFSAPHQSVVAHLGRNEDRNDNCLGPLDDIIDDTDSDLEGLMQ